MKETKSPKDVILKIASNTEIAPGVFKMTLSGDISAVKLPGSFVNIKLEGLYLRRPISVCDAENGILTVVYRVVGEGTEAMSKLGVGAELPVLIGLGNGYDLSKSGSRPLLVGGGVGIPPLYFLAKKLLAEGKKPVVILGFNKKEEMFLYEDFLALGVDVKVATADGSFGTKGFVTDVMAETDYTYFYSCGPMPMYRSMEKIAKTDGEYSLEERMGCGFGACMGCSCETTLGKNRRICKDGPVFGRSEIKWQTQK